MDFYLFSDYFASVAVATFAASARSILVVVVRLLFRNIILVLQGLHELPPRLQVGASVAVAETACLFLVDFLTGEVKDEIDLVVLPLDYLRLFACLNCPQEGLPEMAEREAGGWD
jgi:hypothetical protein